MKIGDILGFLKTAKKAEIDELTKNLTDAKLTDAADLVSKAAANLADGEKVKDQFSAEGKNSHASKEEIKTGPSEQASGGGMDRMTREYSNPTPQSGTQLTAENFERIMAPMNASMKANAQAIVTLTEQFKSFSDHFEAAAKSATRTDTSVTALNAERAASQFGKAKEFLKVARKAVEEAALSDGDEKKACKAQALAARRDAASAIGKALMHAAGAGSKAEDLSTEISAFALKADVEADMEEEKEASKKADTNEGDDKDDKDKKENDDEKKSKKAVDPASDSSALKALEAKVDNALTGMGMMTATVNDLMKTLGGGGRVLTAPPDFAKSVMGAVPENITETIDALEESGNLTDADAMAARDVVSKLGAVAKGQIDKSLVTDRLAKSSASVRELFKEVSAKLAA